jgi:hypothetical protein
MGKLFDKITSYTEQNAIAFNESYALPPTQTGTSFRSDGWTSDGSTNPVYNASGGPIPGEGSWFFNIDNGTSTTSRVRNLNASGTIQTNADFLASANYTVGFWIKIDNFNEVTQAGVLGICRALNSSNQTGSYGYQFSVGWSVPASSKAILIASHAGVTTITTDHLGNALESGRWYYLAMRRTTVGGANTAGTSSTVDYFINGNKKNTITANLPTTTSIDNFHWGAAVAGFKTPVHIANYHLASSANITESDIQAIWEAGSSSNITETPATATALMTEPTIVIVANDNVQVTTSFLASTIIPDNITVSANQNINIVVTEVLTASADLINNIEVDTPISSSFSAEPMTATVLLVQPFIPEDPLIASATMPGGNAVVQANYFSLVKQLSPYVYINNGLTVPVNYGTQSGTFVRGSNLTTNQDGGLPLNLIADGKSWLGSTTLNSNGFFTFETTNFADSFHNVLGTGNFAYEVWVKPRQLPLENSGFGTSATTRLPLLAILNADKLKILLDDGFTTVSTGLTPRYFSLIINNGLNTTTELRANIDPTFTVNNWNHVVVNAYQSGINPNERLIQLWVNGQILINQNIAFTPWSDTTNKVNYVLGSNAQSLSRLSDMYYDELAIYESPLTNSQIIQHHNFISTYGPNYIDNAEPFTASAVSGNNNFIAQSNVNIAETPATSSALFVDPVVAVSRVINIVADPMLSNALSTDVTVFYGRTFVATPMISAAESKEGFVINDIYYEYVQANIAPYRYVNFDGQNEYSDYGTDNDYSVASTVVGGTIVGTDLGIVGKSAKTAGTSYVTDGVILKESEWNDSWGTGANDWHSAFWFQRALDDNSTTGLRVLWNLNGYKDNQHAVLYQYQGKLHMQFNNGSGTFTETDSTALDLFDYNRHFIVIDHNHGGGGSNTVKLYVDSILRFTVNIGSITPTTTNATSADSGPNDEANNHPRLSVGCLITPFNSTALPVAPANTKLIIDEVYWDKNSITSTMVTNLFNIMPDKGNNIVIAEPMTASDELVMPTISTVVVLVPASLTASASLIEPVTTANRQVVYNSNAMTATALAVDARRFENRIILSDIFVATATFNDPGVQIAIPGPTMYASAKLNSKGIYLITVDPNLRLYPNRMLTPWLAYLRATDTVSILPTREVV